jgi:vacuolar-type H+-ATPase subunit I/STV1
MSELGKKGAKVTNQVHQRDGFTDDELPELKTLEDAKRALDQIRRGVLLRRITHSEGSSASKAVSEWVRAHAAQTTEKLVGELHKELEAKEREIEALRRQLSGRKAVKVVK